jgi:hypothetical protein
MSNTEPILDTPILSNHAKSIPFWTENPNVLFKPEYMTEFYPSGDMTYNQKLNAITRLILVATIVIYLYGQNPLTIIYGILSIGAVYLVYYTKHSSKKEGMDVQLSGDATNNPVLAAFGDGLPTNVFDDPTSQNPFSNVLISDYTENPNKKPAPPAFNANVNQTILSQAQKLVEESNPDQPDIAEKLFKNLGEQLDFEQSMRQFYSTSSSTIPNDQEAFSDFCYGSMVSCKEGNMFACAKDLSVRHTMT